jgi:predicted dehydrogenase
MDKKETISRRKFIGASAIAASATMVAPRHVLGGKGYTPPSEKLNIAAIGVGGQGRADINKFSLENIVAFADVDWDRAAGTFRAYPETKQYKDYRRMFDAEKNIDAVVIATPDHTHAVVAMEAMKRGLHVYLEKPMAKTVKEVRVLTEEARIRGVVTQMGNQGHAEETMRLLRELLEDGAIGQVREVEAWATHGCWTEGMALPQGSEPVPDTLDWDLWLGPAAHRPYHAEIYAPYAWRGWWDFGTGQVSNMGIHVFDPLCYALQLSAPLSIEYSGSTFRKRVANTLEVNKESYSRAAIVRYKFGARGNLPPLKLTWYHGGILPERPEELATGEPLDSSGGGAILHGDKGKIIFGSHGARGLRIIPKAKMEQYQRPAKRYPRSVGHYDEWLEACKGGKPTQSDFDFAGPLSEMVLLASVAMRAGEKIEWDAEQMKVTNLPAANEFLHYEYRKGWSL